MSSDKKTRGIEESRVAWFVVLDRARRDNNFVLAARAQSELERLGVKVQFRRPRSKQGVPR